MLRVQRNVIFPPSTTAHRGFSSSPAPFQLIPTITGTTPNPATLGSPLTITLNPAVGPAQQAVLYIGDYRDSDRRPPARHPGVDYSDLPDPDRPADRTRNVSDPGRDRRCAERAHAGRRRVHAAGAGEPMISTPTVAPTAVAESLASALDRVYARLTGGHGDATAPPPAARDEIPASELPASIWRAVAGARGTARRVRAERVRARRARAVRGAQPGEPVRRRVRQRAARRARHLADVRAGPGGARRSALDAPSARPDPCGSGIWSAWTPVPRCMRRCAIDERILAYLIGDPGHRRTAPAAGPPDPRRAVGGLGRLARQRHPSGRRALAARRRSGRAATAHRVERGRRARQPSPPSASGPDCAPYTLDARDIPERRRRTRTARPAVDPRGGSVLRRLVRAHRGPRGHAYPVGAGCR